MKEKLILIAFSVLCAPFCYGSSKTFLVSNQNITEMAPADPEYVRYHINLANEYHVLKQYDDAWNTIYTLQQYEWLHDYEPDLKSELYIAIISCAIMANKYDVASSMLVKSVDNVKVASDVRVGRAIIPLLPFMLADTENDNTIKADIAGLLLNHMAETTPAEKIALARARAIFLVQSKRRSVSKSITANVHGDPKELFEYKVITKRPESISEAFDLYDKSIVWAREASREDWALRLEQELLDLHTMLDYYEADEIQKQITRLRIETKKTIEKEAKEKVIKWKESNAVERSHVAKRYFDSDVLEFYEIRVITKTAPPAPPGMCTYRFNGGTYLFPEPIVTFPSRKITQKASDWEIIQ